MDEQTLPVALDLTEANNEDKRFAWILQSLPESKKQLLWSLWENNGELDMACLATGFSLDDALNDNQFPLIQEAYKHMAREPIKAARDVLQNAVFKALQVKISGLDASDERLQQQAATQILEWVIGKPTARHEHSGPDGKPIEIEGSQNILLSRISRLLDESDEYTDEAHDGVWRELSSETQEDTTVGRELALSDDEAGA